MMGLVDYATDNEDGDGDTRVSSFSTLKGGNLFKSHKGSVIVQPAMFNQPSCSRSPSGMRNANTIASSAVTHRSDVSGGISNALSLESEHTWTRSLREVTARETTGGVVKRKVMSMELAKKRESAYRTKMESLKKQSRDESYKSPKTVQVVSSSTKTTETKRAPPTNISRSPPQRQLPSNLSCSTPQVKQSYRQKGLLQTPRTMEFKRASPAYQSCMSTQGVLNTRTVEIKRPPATNLSCSTPQVKECNRQKGLLTQPPRTMEIKGASPANNQSCMPPQARQSYGQEAQIQSGRTVGIKRAAPSNISCPSPNFRQSYGQEALQIKLARTVEIQRVSQMPLSCSPPQLGQSYSMQSPQIQPVIQFCKECNVMCSGALNVMQHYQGKKHKARVEELKMNNGANMGIELVMCDVCNIPCMNEYNYREHLAGKKHASCLQAIEASKRLRS